MIKYRDLVQYIKDNHVDWNKDLFDVLRGFFEERLQYQIPSSAPIQQELFSSSEFKEPEDGEYTTDDLLNLFST